MPQTRGDSPNDDGVVGTTESVDKSGVFGFTARGIGLRGITQSSAHFGMFGSNDSQDPPPPGSPGGAGVFGLTQSPGAAGVFGANNKNRGVGVQGNGPDAGVSGFSERGVGVRGHSNQSVGVEGFAHVPEQSGVFGMNDAKGSVPDGLNRPAGAGVWGHTKVEKGSGVVGSVEPGLTKAAAAITGIGPTAGRFIGDVEVTGNIHFGGGADCAEYFDAQTHEPAEPGTVLVLGDDGALKASQKAYDRRVAGIVSGAGSFRPAIILDHQVTARTRTLIALLGKTYCKVDAEHGRIEVGDLLTTSPTPGYAMKASDREQAFGAVIGKALQRLEEGQGLIPVLIALQ